MSSNRSTRFPPAIVAILAFGLSGCAGSPLAQMAVSRMAPARQPCAAGASCQTDRTTSAMNGIAKGVGGSFQKLIGGQSDVETLASSTAAR